MNLYYKEIKKEILKHYKDAKCELNYKNEYELLVAVMLSAQCTDKRVNLITPSLFNNYPDIKSLANAKLSFLKEIIQSCNFYNNKAINLIAMAKCVMDNFNGRIPLNQKDLMSLNGVGQKTANVVLIEFLNLNVMAVDTHIFRVSHRLDLSSAKNPTECEKDLSEIFKTKLNKLHLGFVLFGRYICKAKKPDCKSCFLASYCKSNDKNI